MSNDEKHDDSDLSLDLEDTSVDDTSVDEDERSDDSEESEDEVVTDLDLSNKDNEKAKKRDESVNASVKTWAGRIVSGKATYANIPANHQYLIPKIKALLGHKEEVKETQQNDRAEIVREVQAQNRYEILLEKINKTSRTSEQNKILQAEYTVQIKAGISKDVALEKARKFAEVDIDEAADQPRIKTGSGELKSKTKVVYDGTENPNKFSRKQLAEAIASQPTSRR